MSINPFFSHTCSLADVYLLNRKWYVLPLIGFFLFLALHDAGKPFFLSFSFESLSFTLSHSELAFVCVKVRAQSSSSVGASKAPTASGPSRALASPKKMYPLFSFVFSFVFSGLFFSLSTASIFGETNETRRLTLIRY